MAEAGTVSTTLLIAGMRDNQCREHVAAILSRLAGVREAAVNLHRARATVVHDPACEPASLARAVVQAGYAATIARVRRGAAERP